MQITYDPTKSDRNIEQRGLSFEEARHFAFDTALIGIDDRNDHGEVRYIALGWLHQRLHVLCPAETSDGIRVISFRKANEREVKRYAQIQAHD